MHSFFFNWDQAHMWYTDFMQTKHLYKKPCILKMKLISLSHYLKVLSFKTLNLYAKR